MESGQDYQRLPNSADHNCFACSPANDAGFELDVDLDGWISAGINDFTRANVYDCCHICSCLKVVWTGRRLALGHLRSGLMQDWARMSMN